MSQLPTSTSSLFFSLFLSKISLLSFFAFFSSSLAVSLLRSMFQPISPDFISSFSSEPVTGFLSALYLEIELKGASWRFEQFTEKIEMFLEEAPRGNSDRENSRSSVCWPVFYSVPPSSRAAGTSGPSRSSGLWSAWSLSAWRHWCPASSSQRASQSGPPLSQFFHPFLLSPPLPLQCLLCRLRYLSGLVSGMGMLYNYLTERSDFYIFLEKKFRRRSPASRWLHSSSCRLGQLGAASNHVQAIWGE